MNDNAVKVENITKFFGGNKALDNVNFSVEKGELFGLIGPDGAGKTTLLRILAGVMEASTGDAYLAGFCVNKQAGLVREKIGYMSQRFGLYEELTALENINFYADIYKVSSKDRQKKGDELLDFSGLNPFKSRLAGRLSGGMKQKLGLACALIHTPQILLLDEPTNGVDPVSRRSFWQILRELLREKITIVVSTSYLDEAERCNRVGFLHKGKMLAVDAPDEIKKSLNLATIEEVFIKLMEKENE